MARTLTIYQGEDQTPATDITDMVEWPDCEFGQRAYFGESTGSEVRFRDTDGRTGNSQNLPAGLTSLSLAAHNVVRWTEGSNTMFRGRVSPKDYSRGAQVAGRYREVRIALDDYNKDLHNIVVHDYSRPAETDKARVQGILASYLSGNPRITTNLNGSNFVSSSNTVSLPAHTYTRTNVLEVLSSIASAANKQWFVTIDGELFYDGNDSTVYASPLRITTDLSLVDDVTTFEAIWDVGPASREDGQQLLSGIWLFYGQDQYVHVTNPTVANQYSWWEDIVYDDTVTTATQATTVANAILARRQYEERTYNVSIGPLGRAQWGSLKHGQLIQIKAQPIPDADDAFVSRRITELRWTPSSDPESLFAHMTLDRPIKVNPHGPGQKGDTITPKPAPQCAPVDPGGVGAPVAGIDKLCESGGVADACGPWSDTVCWSGSSESFSVYSVIAPGDYYSEIQVSTKYGGYAATTFRVQIRDTVTGNPNLSVVLDSQTLTQCRAGGNFVTLSGTFTVPTGYNQIRFGLLSPGGKATKQGSHEINVYTAPVTSQNDPNCFDYSGPGLPSDSPYWLPSDTVQAMIDAAVADAAVRLDWFIVTDDAYGAVGNGITNDTAAIQAAIDAAEVSGGVVYFPAGTYKVTGLNIAGNYVELRGAGKSSVIAMSSATGDTVALDAAAQRSYVTIRDLRFAPTVTRTADAEIAAENFSNLTLQNLAFTGSSGLINSCIDLGATSRDNVIIFMSNIRAHTFNRFFYGVRLLDLWVSHVSTDANTAAANSVIIEGGVESSTWSQCDFVNSANNDATGTGNALTLRATDYSTTPPQFNTYQSCYFDSHQYGMRASAGKDITFVNCWFSARPGNGGYLDNALCENFAFIGCRFENCGNHGLLLNDGLNHQVIGCSAISNDQQALGGHGFAVASVDGLVFSGNRAYNRASFGGTQDYGLFLQTDVTNFLVIDNDLRGNGTGGINNAAGVSASKIVADNLPDGVGAVEAGCRLRNTATQSITTGTWTTITFNTEDDDALGFHSTVTNTGRITIPAGLDGTYLIGGEVGIAASTTGQRALRLVLNAAVTRIADIGAAPPGATLDARMQIVTRRRLVAGDYIELQAWQDSGGSLNSVNVADSLPQFWCTRLGI